MDKEIRRNRDRMMVSSKAVLAFGAWSALKSAAYAYFMIRDAVTAEVASGEITLQSENGGFFPADLVTAIAFLFLAGLLAADLLMRVYISRCAKKEALGIKTGKAYLVLAVILLIMEAISVVRDAQNLAASNGEGIIADIVTLLVSVTSLYILLELLINAFRLKKQLKLAAAA